jgi:uncharacterized membrane protein (UPF0127 family)
MTRRFLPFAVLLLALAAALPLAPTVAQTRAPATTSASAFTELAIDSDGKTHKFRVEVAANDADRQRGLMYRREMAADAGMIFDFGYEQPVSMWMANTYIPLDMLFITADGKVAHVAARTVPESRATVSAPRPVRYVLELNGGTAERLSIKPGAQVRHAMLGNLR